jgi:hypothetical protein
MGVGDHHLRYYFRMDHEPKRSRLGTGVSDMLSNLSSAALFVSAAALFLAGAVGGIGLVGRLGGAGWFMYALVIGTYALVFGPVIASAVTLRQNGSPRFRAEVERRREQQRRKYRLDALERDAQARTGEHRAPATSSTSPAVVTNGPMLNDGSVTNPGKASSDGDATR